MAKKDYPTLQKEKERREWDEMTDEQKWVKYQEVCDYADQLYRKEA